MAETALDVLRRAQFNVSDILRRAQGDVVGAFGLDPQESPYQIITSRALRTSSCMAGNPILVEVSGNQDLTVAAANQRTKFILGFAHQLRQLRYVRRDPSWLIFGERVAADRRPGAQSKKVEEGRPPTTFAIATSDAFFERPKSVRAQGSYRALIDGDHSLAKALRDFENLEALAAPNSIIAIHGVVPMTWMPKRQRRRPRQRSVLATNLGHDKRARLRDLRNFRRNATTFSARTFCDFYGTADRSKATDHPFDMCR